MAFVDYGSEIQATTAMRRHQGHRFDETDGPRFALKSAIFFRGACLCI